MKKLLMRILSSLFLYSGQAILKKNKKYSRHRLPWSRVKREEEERFWGGTKGQFAMNWKREEDYHGPS